MGGRNLVGLLEILNYRNWVISVQSPSPPRLSLTLLIEFQTSPRDCSFDGIQHVGPLIDDDMHRWGSGKCTHKGKRESERLERFI